MCLALPSCLFKAFELFWSNPQNLIETSFVKIFILSWELENYVVLASSFLVETHTQKYKLIPHVSELSTLPLREDLKLVEIRETVENMHVKSFVL